MKNEQCKMQNLLSIKDSHALNSTFIILHSIFYIPHSTFYLYEAH